MNTFDTLIERVLGHEGGYVNDPQDPGGETNWGITIGFARSNGYNGRMADLTREEAIELYRKGFWFKVHANEMQPALSFQALDFAVNSGPEVAIRYLQRALGVADDGRWGPATQAAQDSSDDLRTSVKLLALRLQFMVKLKNWSRAGGGWANRIADDLLLALKDA